MNPQRIATGILTFLILTGISYAGKVTLSVSPIHLLLGIGEFALEYDLDEALSVVLIGGVGSMKAELSNGDETNVDVLEYGLQGRYYISSSSPTSGWNLGVEAVWIDIQIDPEVNVSAQASGLMVGPLLGYKAVWDSGFTLDTQLGYGFMAVEAEAKDSSTGETSEGSAETSNVILNFNIGWNF